MLSNLDKPPILSTSAHHFTAFAFSPETVAHSAGKVLFLVKAVRAPTATRSTLSLNRKRPSDPDGLHLHVVLALCLCAALLSPEEGQDADDDDGDGCKGRGDGYPAFRASGEGVVRRSCNGDCESGWTTLGGRRWWR
jgi:hypothetical protein